jgi:uncharacterized protein YneF (UPF0154 family)
MNIIAIILIVIIIFLVYILYAYFIASSTTTISRQLNLNNSNPPIMGSSITDFTNLNTAYGVWIYVNSWNNTQQKPIYNIQNSATTAKTYPSELNNISLRLDQFSPTLYCDILDTTKKINTIQITNVFPIQKWVYVIISVDGSVVDIYIDGKLVISKQITNAIQSSNNNQITFGSGLDIILENFQKFNIPMDPSTAINNYNTGNGKSSFASMFNFNRYQVQLSVLKNNVQQAQITI